MSTIYLTHKDCLNHVTPEGHPEQVARLKQVDRALSEERFDALLRVEAPMADELPLRLVHPQAHIDRIKNTSPLQGIAPLDADTSMSPGSLVAALRAVGGNVAAVDRVLAGKAENAFVAARPPGHHAEAEKPMGFCLFGNVAIAAKHALERHGLMRVAVVDFDVHHGNGTQSLLWHEARCLFASTHQVPLYPGSGEVSETGAHGNVLNVPLEADSGSAEMRVAYDEVILPAVRAFQPELVLVSAGFDAHRDDPLAQLNWDVEDFRWVTHRICDVADEVCEGRVVSTLEGGYDLAALAASVAAHVEVLMERGA